MVRARIRVSCEVATLGTASTRFAALVAVLETSNSRSTAVEMAMGMSTKVDRSSPGTRKHGVAVVEGDTAAAVVVAVAADV